MTNVKTIGLPTRFDYSYHQEFYRNCSEIIENQDISEIILDFGLVEYMDSSALGMLVILHKKAGSKKVKISRARGTVKEVLILANIEKIIEIIK